MNIEMLHAMLKEGYDRNIVVYDSDSQNGEFTKRLIAVMKTVVRRMNSLSGKLTTIIVEPLNNYSEPKVDFKINIIQSGLMFNIEQYYLDVYKGTFPSGCSKLAIGVTNKMNVVLGAY